MIVSLLGLLILFPIITIAWIVSAIDTKSNGFFTQNRIGKNGKIFRIIKIKTMKKIDGVNTNITTSDDVRLTKSGIFIRKNKIDELPQLIDVLYGKMSIVGPRPELKEYVDTYSEEIKNKILSVKPGITDYASILMTDESLLLASYKSPQEAYTDNILPKKLGLSIKYVDNNNIFLDVKIIFLTLKKIIFKR